MEKKFNPEKYGMEVCDCCNSQGYIFNPTRQCCPKCGGFGFVKKEEVQEDLTPLIQKKDKNL